MKAYIYKFFAVFAVMVAVFMAARLMFIRFYSKFYGHISIGDLWDVLSHGFAMDCSMAGYLTMVPALGIIASVFSHRRWLGCAETVWYVIVSLVLGAVFYLDMALYGFWGFRLDMTPFFYFATSPGAVLGSLPASLAFYGIFLWLMLSAIIFAICFFTIKMISLPVLAGGRRRTVAAAVLGVLTLLLFIPIRGGVTVSTMNLSRAYFSQNQRLNHAAINPFFSLLYSATHQSGNHDNLNFYDDIKPFESLVTRTDSASVRTDTLLTVQRPDIYIIILESFSSHLLPTQGGEAIATRLDSIASDGLLFTNFYANTFRTDRALPSILNGYPGIPPVSVMKYVDKLEKLPSLPKTLKQNGYELSYYYGGDVNFTNMLAFLVSGGFDNIVCDKDFSLSERMGKWGAHDNVLLARVACDIDTGSAPQLRVVQTSSSHEPFEVPYNKLANPAANAFAFTDSVVGDFVRRLESSPRWNNTLVVLVPDHYGAYPMPLDEMPARHHVPMVLTGGALALRGTVDVPASQADIAATLLGALGIEHGEFRFSRDIFDADAPHSAFFLEPELAGFVDADGSNAVLNVVSGDLSGVDPESDAATKLKATLQLLNNYFKNL